MGFDPDALREGLRPLVPGEPVILTPEEDAYLRHYGIGFSEEFPALAYHFGAVEADEHRIAAHLWMPAEPRGTAVVMHGYYDHSGLYGKLARWALEQRCNVLLFDLPGHGLSTGEPAVIDDFADYGRAVADVLECATLPGLPLWVMAQSTGCAAVMSFARQSPWPFDATVLLAPLVRPAGWRGVRLAHRFLAPFIDSVPRRFAASSSDPEFLDFLRRDPLQCHRVPLRWVGALRRWLAALEREDLGVGPALVIQGDRDDTVEWRYNVPFVQTLFPGSAVAYIEGAGHQLANESEPLRREYLQIVTEYLATRGIALESGSWK